MGCQIDAGKSLTSLKSNLQSHLRVDFISCSRLLRHQHVSLILGIILRQPISLRHTIPNLLLLLRRHRSPLLITALLPHMLIIPRMPLAQIRIPQEMQILASRLRRHGIARTSDCVGDGRRIGGTLAGVQYPISYPPPIDPVKLKA